MGILCRRAFYYTPATSFEGDVLSQSQLRPDPPALQATFSLKSHMILCELFNLCPVASSVKWVWYRQALSGSILNQCNGLNNAPTEQLSNANDG